MIRRRANSQSGGPRGRVGQRRPAGPSPASTPPPAPTSPLASTSLGASPLWVRMAWGAAFAIVIGGLIWVLRPVFAVLAASAGLAYILDPPVDWLERRRLSRESAIGVVFSAMLGSAALVGLLFVPSFVRQAGEIWTKLDPFIRNLDQTVAPVLAWLSETSGRPVTLDLADLQALAPGWIEENAARVQETGTQLVRGLFTQGLGVMSTIVNLTLLPVFVFYLLRDWDKLVSAIGDLIPHAHRARSARVATEVDRRLSAFVRGQITVSAIMAVLYSIGLLIVGIDLAIAVGVLSGMLFVVPYLGTAVGIVLATILALLKFGIGWELLQLVAVFAIVQLIEGYLLTPRIVGEQVGLHPLVVMIALIVGGSLLGIWGMLLAIPITAVASVLGGEWLAIYRASDVFRETSDP
jgi:predicted PurR-regulated permease PerM